jgi:hypothetical protein
MGKPPAMSVSVVFNQHSRAARSSRPSSRVGYSVSQNANQELFGQLEAKGDAFEVFTLGQPSQSQATSISLCFAAQALEPTG